MVLYDQFAISAKVDPRHLGNHATPLAAEDAPFAAGVRFIKPDDREGERRPT